MYQIEGGNILCRLQDTDVATPCRPEAAKMALPPDPVIARSLYRDYGKRLLDLTLVALSLPVTVPLTLLIAVVIACNGGAPFFGHVRVGLGGRRFRCWKLRSMVVDAEHRLHHHLANDAAARREWDAHFKLENDPRITRLGHFLRRSSLDELPQLWNVIRGDMSLVGSRPVTEQELPRYGPSVRAYLAQKPGVTGKWQVSGRNALSYDERVALDVAYLADISLVTDLRVISETVSALVRQTGR